MKDQEVNDRRPPLPSSSRTCGFPASGFRRTFLCEAFTTKLFGFRAQPRSPDLEVLCSRFGFHRSNAVPSLFESAPSCQGPLAPRALPRFIATMGLSDSPAPSSRLMDSARALLRQCRNWWQGSPSLPNQTVPARRPQPPRRSPPLRVNVASRRMIGFGFSERLADLTSVTRLNRVCFTLRLAGSIHGASTPQLLPALSASLHARRSVGMMNTFHFIGLGWRCWRTRGRQGFARGFSVFECPEKNVNLFVLLLRITSFTFYSAPPFA